MWQDTRVDPLVAFYAGQGGKDRFRARTGLPLASYFSGLKLKWLLDNVAGARQRAQAGELLFGTIDSWVLWNLTGGAQGGLHVTDVTNASRTQLMRLDSLAWDDELLSTFSIPRSLLPRIASSSEVYGEVATGPLRGVPIAGILGDQQAALVGQTCFRPGEAKNTYGTGCFLLMNTGTTPVSSAAGLVTTVAYRFGKQPAHYALEGSIAIAGALVQWLRDNLGLIAKSSDVEALAASVADNGDVYIVPAFSGLYAPYWKDSARGVIAGLTRYATRAHIARAALEATAYQTRDVLTAMEQDSGIQLSELRVDGGMVVNELLMQFQADILDVTVVRPKVTETTALGAAYAAGLATGYWRSTDELTQNWGVDEALAAGDVEGTARPAVRGVAEGGHALVRLDRVMATAQAQLDAFIAKYSPDVAKLGRAAIARMRKLLPAAQVLVYDNYNALAVGFRAERAHFGDRVLDRDVSALGESVLRQGRRPAGSAQASERQRQRRAPRRADADRSARRSADPRADAAGARARRGFVAGGQARRYRHQVDLGQAAPAPSPKKK